MRNCKITRIRLTIWETWFQIMRQNSRITTSCRMSCRHSNCKMRRHKKSMKNCSVRMNKSRCRMKNSEPCHRWCSTPVIPNPPPTHQFPAPAWLPWVVWTKLPTNWPNSKLKSVHFARLSSQRFLVTFRTSRLQDWIITKELKSSYRVRLKTK